MKMYRRNCLRHYTLGLTLCSLFVLYLIDQSINGIDEDMTEYYNFNEMQLRDENYELQETMKLKNAKKVQKKNANSMDIPKQTGIKKGIELLKSHHKEYAKIPENSDIVETKRSELKAKLNMKETEQKCNMVLNLSPEIVDLDETNFYKNDLDWLHMYSAYLIEENKKPSMKIIAMVNINSYHGNRNNTYCMYFYMGKSAVAKATTRLVFEKDSSLYRDAIITCDVDHGAKPESVAIVTDPCTNVTRAWKVRIPEVRQKRMDFVVCVFLPASYHDFQEFREFIEVNRMFGFDNFAIYYNHIGKTVQKYLEYYNELGILKVFEWNIPNKIKQISQFQGKLSAYNDCLLKFKHSTKYLVFLNINDILVPKNSTLSQFAETQAGGACAYLIKTATFWKVSTTQRNNTLDLFGLQTLKKINRDKIIRSHDSSSRYISNVKYLKIAGDTKPIQCDRSSSTVFVDKDTILSHIYVDKLHKVNNFTTVDKTMLLYGNDILSRLLNVAQEINGFK